MTPSHSNGLVSEAANFSMPAARSTERPVEPLGRVDELFGRERMLVSFEFFPPRNDEGEALLMQTIEDLRPLKPDFVSITRTGGGVNQTVDLSARIQNEIGIRAMAHQTCAGHSSEEMGGFLDNLWGAGVKNVLALRGDPQAGHKDFQAVEGGFSYAQDLVSFAAQRHPFCIGVAGYPEGHPQCLNMTRDLEHLKRKLDAGAQFVVTQLFFDNEDFYRWRDMAQKMGIDAPLVAGIMPILSVSQIKRFVTMCGAKIPNALLLRLESLESDEMSVHAAGVEHAIQQCRDLRQNGVAGLHFYTLNRSKATVLISQELDLPASSLRS